MNVQVVSRTKKPLVSREDVSARVEFAGTTTPQRKQIREAVASAIGAELKLVSLVKVSNEFGSSSVKVDARVYDSEEALKRLEEKHLIERESGKKKEGEEKKEEPKKEEAKK